MRGAYGKPNGLSARVKINQVMFSIRTTLKGEEHAVEALRKVGGSRPLRVLCLLCRGVGHSACTGSKLLKCSEESSHNIACGKTRGILFSPTKVYSERVGRSFPCVFRSTLARASSDCEGCSPRPSSLVASSCTCRATGASLPSPRTCTWPVVK